MKIRTALLSLGAALSGCPLAIALDLSEPLCRASDLAPSVDPEQMPDEAIVVVVCEVGRVTTRDKHGQVFTRRWIEQTECDLRDLTDAVRGVGLRGCPRSR